MSIEEKVREIYFSSTPLNDMLAEMAAFVKSEKAAAWIEGYQDGWGYIPRDGNPYEESNV